MENTTTQRHKENENRGFTFEKDEKGSRKGRGETRGNRRCLQSTRTRLQGDAEEGMRRESTDRCVVFLELRSEEKYTKDSRSAHPSIHLEHLCDNNRGTREKPKDRKSVV